MLKKTHFLIRNWSGLEMTLSGKKSAVSAGIEAPHRDELYSRIALLGEGAIFNAQEVLRDDASLADDFQKLRGYDYVHLYDGLYTGIVETTSLRKLPKLELLLEAYEARENCALHSTGDRIAFLMRIKEWEPILGHRFYTDGKSRIVSFGQMRIRTIHAPQWLMQDDETSLLLRVFFDTPQREMSEAVARARQVARLTEPQILAAAALARALAEQGATPPSETEIWSDLTDLASAIEAALEKHNARSTAVLHVARKRP
jgi:hypothetical protein